MIWLSFVLVGALALAPTALLLRRQVSAGKHGEPALALHRARLASLDRDRDDGLIAATEFTAARLEVQRFLLADTTVVAVPPKTGTRAPVVILLVLIPLGSLGLYSFGGHPELGAQPLAHRLAAAKTGNGQDAKLIALLETQLAALPPASAQARQGFILLGEARAAQGDWPRAAGAFQHALEAGFDPTLAVQAAEAQVQADHKVSEQSAALFRRALDAGPHDAPWRLLAEQRIAQSEAH